MSQQLAMVAYQTIADQTTANLSPVLLPLAPVHGLSQIDEQIPDLSEGVNQAYLVPPPMYFDLPGEKDLFQHYCASLLETGIWQVALMLKGHSIKKGGKYEIFSDMQGIMRKIQGLPSSVSHEVSVMRYRVPERHGLLHVRSGAIHYNAILSPESALTIGGGRDRLSCQYDLLQKRSIQYTDGLDVSTRELVYRWLNDLTRLIFNRAPHQLEGLVSSAFVSWQFHQPLGPDGQYIFSSQIYSEPWMGPND